jgi:Spy/CpxP family protein refolding chaperone
MNRERFYKIVILLLLLLNLGVLGYLVTDRRDPVSHPPLDGRPGPAADRVIVNRLDLTENQQEQFAGLKHEHHRQMLELQEESSELHKELYALLQYEKPDNKTKDSLLHLLQQNALTREQVTFEHFKKLRGILTPEQEPAFDEFVEDLSRRILGPHRRHR